jgi:hypothetical protein
MSDIADNLARTHWPQYMGIQAEVQRARGAANTITTTYGANTGALIGGLPKIWPTGLIHQVLLNSLSQQVLLNSSIKRAGVMADISREEMDAKFDAAEARSETRFVELSGKLDRVVDSISSLRNEVVAVRADNKFTRLTIIVAVVGSVIAGLAALWVTQSNMLASFTAGIALHEAKPAASAPPSAPKSQ